MTVAIGLLSYKLVTTDNSWKEAEKVEDIEIENNVLEIINP